MEKKKLGLPQPDKIPNTDIGLAHVYVGDEPFALTQSLMRPFPRRQLNNDRRIFSYRLARAKRQVKCAFGIASSMWSQNMLQTLSKQSALHTITVKKGGRCGAA
ncbi:hypothetical protein PoB_004406000 [Plakobranchus ocellatus]|uniref:DDE Tnp4 domain-containing protein n=1 Tax=Plakobranchus ocellatus TaxID=259542 RepID=A0AAV4BDD2_9GAST|nr:hypothetical protein PoB_004406000 [Plakobranchus ocellatus]